MVFLNTTYKKEKYDTKHKNNTITKNLRYHTKQIRWNHHIKTQALKLAHHLHQSKEERTDKKTTKEIKREKPTTNKQTAQKMSFPRRNGNTINQNNTKITTLTNKKHNYVHMPKKLITIIINTHTYHNKMTLPLNRALETKLGPLKNTLPNHPQTYHNIHKTHFYKNNNTQSKDENQNLLETLISNLKHTNNNNTFPHNTQLYTLPTTKSKLPSDTFHNIKLILCYGDIEKNPGPKFTLLLNHPQIHQKKHNTYFYKNTTQIKNEYVYILELF
jgi:hypothetical protein